MIRKWVNKMYKVLGSAFLWCVLICAANVDVVNAGAGESWMDGEIAVSELFEVPTRYQQACSGERQRAMVKWEGEREVCIATSKSLTVGTYESGGWPKVAAARGLDRQLVPLGGSCYLFGCVYSGQFDTLVTRRGVGEAREGLVAYSAITEKVRPSIDPVGGLSSYSLEGQQPDFQLPEEIGAIGLSRNGKWAVAEMKNKGLLVLDLSTLTARRISAYGAWYGIGMNPAYELTVSDDGEVVAAFGFNLDPMIITVPPDCGEIVSGRVSTNFSIGVKVCPSARMHRGMLRSDYYSSHNPRFDATGKRLEIEVRSTTNKTYRQILRTADYIPMPTLQYIALGDSFTSGEGETDARYYESNVTRCHVSKRSYPYVLAESLDIPVIGVKNAACSGAQLKDVLTGESGRSAQIETVREALPVAVTIGIGGNDAGLMRKLSGCAMLDTCHWATSPQRRRQTALEIQALFDPLVSTYGRLREASPNSRVYAVGYPRMLSPDDTCDLVTAVLFDATERQFIREAIDYLNLVIQMAAHRAGISFIDVADSFGGDALCGGGTFDAMNGLRWSGDISQLTNKGIASAFASETFHPTPHGHYLVARTIERQVGNILTTPLCPLPSCELSLNAPEPSGYWDAEESHRQIGHNLVIPEVVSPRTEITVASAAYSFKPDSRVLLQVFSDQMNIGEFTVDEKGRAVAKLQLPEGLDEGFHTIHMVGTSFNGEAIDLYDVVLVRSEAEAMVSSALATVDFGGNRAGLQATTIFSAPVLNDDISTTSVLGVSTQFPEQIAESKDLINSWLDYAYQAMPILAAVGAGGVLAVIVYRRKAQHRI